MSDRDQSGEVIDLKIPRYLAEKISRVAKAKKAYTCASDSEPEGKCEAYREWANAGYSIYNDRG